MPKTTFAHLEEPQPPEPIPSFEFGKEIAGLPVPIWGALISCLFMNVGWNWDISWHRSVGRDTVWTPPHIAIYVALVLAFVYCSGLVLSSTFGRRAQTGGIRVLGFKGPSGAFITLWGILMQFGAILFDNWWHNIYGLDIGVFSPPHSILGWGIAAFYAGQFALVAMWRNTSPDKELKTRWIAMIVWAIFTSQLAINVDPSYGPLGVRAHPFVLSSTLVFPIAIMLIHSYIGRRWASTISAGLYMLAIILMMQIFQLFPATPKFGPVFHRITVLLPPAFPLMLIVPAFIVSAAVEKLERLGTALRGLIAGAAFVLSFNVTNWLWSGFMTSSWADNSLFCGSYPSSAFEEHFRSAPTLALNATGFLSIGLALVGATVMSWAGLAGGKWLRGLVR